MLSSISRVLSRVNEIKSKFSMFQPKKITNNKKVNFKNILNEKINNFDIDKKINQLNTNKKSNVYFDKSGVNSLGSINPANKYIKNYFSNIYSKNLSNLNNNTKKFDNNNIESTINYAAKKYKIPSNLIKSIIKAESNFDQNAMSKKGALGLMQIMPETAKSLGLKNPFNPIENILKGTKYFKGLLSNYNNDIIKALAAYNAGPKNVVNGLIPNFKETKNYINNVMKYYKEYSKI